jgi:hypothetical protein
MSATVHRIKPASAKPAKPVPTSIPEDFSLSPELVRWAAERGITRLQDRIEHFIDVAHAKGYVYLDWPAAFRNSCRQDWARLGAPVAVPRCPRCAKPITGGWTQRQDGRVCDMCDRQGRL